MSLCRSLTSLALAASLILLAGCAACFDGPHPGCPQPQPIKQLRDDPSNGADGGM
jgi:hypothetical protein